MKKLKNIKILLVAILIIAISISANAKENAGSPDVFNNFKDTVYAYANGQSDSQVFASAYAYAGGNSEGSAYVTGTGDNLNFISSLYMEVDNPVTGSATGYVTASDTAEAGSTGTTGSSGGYNTISIASYIQGIGDSTGYTLAQGWEI